MCNTYLFFLVVLVPVLGVDIGVGLLVVVNVQLCYMLTCTIVDTHSDTYDIYHTAMRTQFVCASYTFAPYD